MPNTLGCLPYTVDPVTSTTTASGAVMVAGTPAPQAGIPQYTLYVKFARINVRSITGGAIQLGGGASSDSPVILKVTDVGERTIGPLQGMGLKLTDNAGLTYTATGSNLDYSIQVEVQRLRNDL